MSMLYDDLLDLLESANGRTVKDLLDEFDVDIDLNPVLQNIGVGVLNKVVVNKDSVTLKSDEYTDNKIIINTKKDSEYGLIRTVKISDEFVHEEAYDKNGLLLYQT